LHELTVQPDTIAAFELLDQRAHGAKVLAGKLDSPRRVCARRAASRPAGGGKVHQGQAVRSVAETGRRRACLAPGMKRP
jgi:hypothetical protein